MTTMTDILKKVTWAKTMAAAFTTFLGVAIAWQTLGWDTVAMSSDLEEAIDEHAVIEKSIVVAQEQQYDYYLEQKTANDETRLMILYDRLADLRNAIAAEERIAIADPSDTIAHRRIGDITTAMERIQRQIRQIENGEN